jgi:hypothetical protein
MIRIAVTAEAFVGRARRELQRRDPAAGWGKLTGNGARLTPL